MNIDELNLSEYAIELLFENGYTSIESLVSEDFFSLSKKFTITNTVLLIRELNHFGYLFPANKEKTVYDYDMSTRLRNSLLRNHILYLSQLKTYPKEEIMNFINFGKSRFEELEKLCAANHFNYYVMPALPHALSKDKKNFSKLVKLFAKAQIKSFDDFIHLTLRDIFLISGYDYWLTATIHYSFKLNKFSFAVADKPFVFEYFNKKYAKAMYNEKILYMYNLLDVSDDCKVRFCQEYKLCLNTIVKGIDKFLSDKKNPC